ncbi:Suppressor of kinetochore protein 1 [Reticulomyxa filosa]|uniref:Suppressor of kinetochore protein 1 n=1 Tax=Reticulomyxa filosa TaxID=46433 RepID=X6ML07_RETFI|nr:Suppressor of kinetochore protein 1 [Reticulomyxa filosa]|eukprot:ETO13755.1 Suppressor of kinetochore protein 1 [Reticulomyxa filosa]
MSTEEKKEQPTETVTKEEQGGLDDDGDDEIVLKTVGEDGKDGKSFSIKKKYCKLSNFVMTILKGDPTAKEIEVRQVGSDTLENIVKYLNEHKGEEPPPLPCPVRSTEMSQIVSVKWDAEFIDAFDKKAIFEIILVCMFFLDIFSSQTCIRIHNMAGKIPKLTTRIYFFDIKSLLHLGCAKIATLIKKLDQKGD